MVFHTKNKPDIESIVIVGYEVCGRVTLTRLLGIVTDGGLNRDAQVDNFYKARDVGFYHDLEKLLTPAPRLGVEIWTTN